MKAVFIEKTGGLDVLKFGDFPDPTPAAGEALVDVEYSGVNFIDTYHRGGLYPLTLPAVIGSEGAGTIEKLGPGVEGFHVGDRVAYAMARGSYAQKHAVPARFLVKVPQNVELRQAAAVMLQGMTAHYLSHSTFPLKHGHTALVHAAAGGTGRLLVQIATMLGARVIATAGSPAKAELAKSAGASDVILYDQQDFLAEVKRIAGGVDVVYDSVGKATFLKGLDCLKPRGMMVSFGQSSGPVPAIEPLLLSQKGSLFLTRPSLGQYLSPEELKWRSGDLFKWIAEGKLHLRIDHEYPLSEARAAQEHLEARKTTGKLLLKT
jgi:NADPH2:quinone reductase